MLKFSHSIDILEDMDIGIAYNNLESNLIKTYKNKLRLYDGNINVEKGKIDEVIGNEWSTMTSMLSKANVNSYGVKTFPGLGPYGFYTESDKSSTIKLPIKRVAELPEVKSLTLTNNGEYIIYKLEGDITLYDFIRITLRNKSKEFDFIVTPNEGVINKPLDSTGEYNLSAIGYKDEISKFSEEKGFGKFTISGEN